MAPSMEVWDAGPVADRRERALLRLYSGEATEDICADLAIAPEQLAEWDRTTEPHQLRPRELRYSSSTLSPPQRDAPRTDLGMRVGPPDRPTEAVQEVHAVAGPSESGCLRCGREVLPAGFPVHSWTWPAFVLVQKAREASSVRLITEEEAGRFPQCSS